MAQKFSLMFKNAQKFGKMLVFVLKSFHISYNLFCRSASFTVSFFQIAIIRKNLEKKVNPILKLFMQHQNIRKIFNCVLRYPTLISIKYLSVLRFDVKILARYLTSAMLRDTLELTAWSIKLTIVNLWR